ncbi:MAG TPA: tRNA-dihydrouridine synthase [Candidatus Saccharimonadales bacterium]|nr:tRNA-dihydrouridine synthase [Candidatus Saccharimonadales bacterium]
MPNILDKLPKPFTVLAPMDDVTDTVFRQIIADSAPPDLFFTEFVNVDGLQSPGREKLLPKLQFTDNERPIIAQIWGKNPENFYKTARELVDMGFDGVDLNFGCPEKNVIKNGLCIAMINNRGLTEEIIQAAREGVNGSLPLSVKTRLGLNEVDYTWHEFLLNLKLNMLTIHGRTAKQMSKVPADWSAIEHVRKLRDVLCPQTLIVGNGDAQNKSEAKDLVKKHGLDGVMIGRGIFDDPFAFADKSPWPIYSKQQKIKLYKKHVEFFAKTWTKDERKVHTLNKFCKVYINGFDGAKELREKLMSAENTKKLLEILS